MNLSCVLFDIGSIIAESEEIHRRSFNEAFKEFGLSWYWDEAINKELVFVGGGKERIRHYIKRAWPEMLKQKNLTKYIESVHKIKSQIYEEFLNELEIKPRPGIIRLLTELKKEEIRLAIVSDTTKENLVNLFKKGLDIDPYKWFEVLGHGGCSAQKKPSSDIYLWTLEKLKLPPEACLAIEDSPRGVESANEAGLKVLITPSIYTKDEKFENSDLVISDLGEPKEPFQILKGKELTNNYVDYKFLKSFHDS